MNVTLPLSHVPIADLIEDHREGIRDAGRVRLTDEDRVRAVEVIDVVGVVPLVHGWVRRGGGMAVEDELSLRPHPVIYSHVCLPYSAIGLDGILML